MPVSSRIITLLSALALLQPVRGGVAVYNVSTLAGSGVAGGTDGVGALATFSAPTLLLDDARGVVYIAEQNGCRLRTLNISSRAVTTLAGSGTCVDFNGVGAAAGMNQPEGFALAWPLLYVGSVNTGTRVRVVNVTSRAVRILAGTATSASTNGVGTAASFANPRGVAVDAVARVLYVAEYNTCTLRALNLTTLATTTIAGSSGA